MWLQDLDRVRRLGDNGKKKTLMRKKRIVTTSFSYYQKYLHQECFVYVEKKGVGVQIAWGEGGKGWQIMGERGVDISRNKWTHFLIQLNKWNVACESSKIGPTVVIVIIIRDRFLSLLPSQPSPGSDLCLLLFCFYFSHTDMKLFCFFSRDEKLQLSRNQNICKETQKNWFETFSTLVLISSWKRSFN